MTEPNGLNTKLAAVLTNLSTVLTDLSSVVADLNGLRGLDNLGLGDLNGNLAAIRETLNDTQELLNNQYLLLGDTIGARVGEDSLSLWALTEGIYNNIGQPTGDATTTVLGRLSAIERLLKCGCPPEGPDLTDPDVPCSEPYTSIAFRTQTTSLYPGRVFAGWLLPPPVGITANSFLEVPVGDCELNRTTSDPGYFIYIQSQAPTASLNPLNPQVVRTNEWLDWSLYDENIAVSVAEPYDLTVYICTPGEVTWTDCININSIQSTYHTDQPFSMDLHVIQLDTIPGATLTYTWFANGNTHSFDDINTVVTDNWHGVKITMTAGVKTRITWLDTSGAMDGVNLDSIGANYTIPIDTTMVTIANFTTTDPSTHPFSVEICPPEPG
jgi:hypothetical protein